MTPADPGEREPSLVLVVDDDERVRALLARVVSLSGHRVLEAGDGAEALAMVAKHCSTIAAVLSDVRMPVVDGEELARALLESHPEIPVVLITSHWSSAQADLPNVRHVIVKPFAVESLARLIEGLLSGGSGPALSAADAPPGGA
jgi:two-component system, cell cycle sensor histidine kinase and response regulator CckA